MKTELKKKQAELSKLFKDYRKNPQKFLFSDWRYECDKLESEIDALKQQRKLIKDEKECYNCKDKVKMVSKGEFCPHCMCDQ